MGSERDAPNQPRNLVEQTPKTYQMCSRDHLRKDSPRFAPGHIRTRGGTAPQLVMRNALVLTMVAAWGMCSVACDDTADALVKETNEETAPARAAAAKAGQEVRETTRQAREDISEQAEKAKADLTKTASKLDTKTDQAARELEAALREGKAEIDAAARRAKMKIDEIDKKAARKIRQDDSEKPSSASPVRD